MTPSQHAQHIRQIAFELKKAEHGLAMPYDRKRVLTLRAALHDAELELLTSDGFTEQAGGY